MSKEHLNYLRRKTADEAELWAADRIEQLEAELKTERCLSFRSQVAELEAERDKLKIALNFARQGYQSRFENGDAGDVEWAEMYIQSIDAALAKGEIND